MPNETIFIVDDDKAVADSYEWMLSGVGYDVKKFYDAATFLKEYSAGTQGCLILDIRMPKMTGIELHKIMMKKNIKLPVIYLTGHADKTSITEASNQYVVAFLTKPVPSSILLDNIKKAFSIKIDGTV